MKDVNMDLDFASNLARNRRFTVLLLISVDKLKGGKSNAKLVSLLAFLSGFIGDITVEGGIARQYLSSIIAMFLPNLKKCSLGIWWNDKEALVVAQINPQSNVNHRLESLQLSYPYAAVVAQLFRGCIKLKAFFYDDVNGPDIEQVNNFLATQNHLDKLCFTFASMACAQLSCFQLRKLEVECKFHVDEERAVAEFLKKLPNLTNLDITCAGYPSSHLMKEICRLAKLGKLTIRKWHHEDDDENEDDEDTLERLVNFTVKQLHIVDDTGRPAKLLKIFLGVDVESICLYREPAVLDLSDVPPTTISKIKIKGFVSEDFAVKFSSSYLPANVEQFESAVMKFAEEKATRITAIEIGHETWRNSGAFSVQRVLQSARQSPPESPQARSFQHR